ncbi:MAG: phosphoribosyltransferase [Micavibrio aeruginosavorus]|uniref:Phosphoribosyltransferase n=1 Tax=Micavibrio aeruginosavorus TaxID=349221 RepID=A0A7T5R1F3_9BACT|nr:MAG: phosphoribosyltransferase [Micavibrio aeruginosavorus]
MYQKFRNREEAGLELSNALSRYKENPDTIILALPRGGVPVAHEVAKALGLPMDIWLVRKLGVPGHEELAMGAIALNGVCHINKDIIFNLNIAPHLLNQVMVKERAELDRRNKLYRQGRRAPDIRGKTAIVVDDGLATGATMHAAVESIRQVKASHIVVAVPVGSKSTCEDLKAIADDVVCLRMPEPFYGVGQWYLDFSQTSDEEVQNLLEQPTGNAA